MAWTVAFNLIFGHTRQLFLDESGDEIVSISEVVIEGGAPDTRGEGDLTQREVGSAGLLDQGLGRVEQCAPGERLVLVYGGGPNSRHRRLKGYPDLVATATSLAVVP